MVCGRGFRVVRGRGQLLHRMMRQSDSSVWEGAESGDSNKTTVRKDE